ncbi:Ent-kaurene oxidase [Grifola frondosa]|uniref:Ent-kaurene oxidase n=1 Tax=Grifola frondosa TaxID=5627 RepID=A0A1C7M942_GRIFR|nr:Ent-kaurene oxidase [Grifola frondosa]
MLLTSTVTVSRLHFSFSSHVSKPFEVVENFGSSESVPSALTASNKSSLSVLTYQIHKALVRGPGHLTFRPVHVELFGVLERHFSRLMSDSSLLILALAVLPVILFLSSLLKPANRKLSRIPTIGPSAPLLSYYGVYKFLIHGPDMIREGYNKYKGSAFKIADLNGWHVIVSGPSLIEELRKAGDDQLSSKEALNELVQAQYTFGPSVHDNPYHISILRSQLTRNLAEIFPEVHDEIVSSFTDAISLTGDEWTAVPALATMMQVICRTSNRIFVGLPKCRDPDYSALNVQFTIDVIKGAVTINLFPDILKPIAGRLFTNVNASISRGVRHLERMILERYRAMEEFGDDWPDKPNDTLQRLMDVAQSEERTVRALVLRILAANFAAIHSSSMSFTQALYYLAANPEFVGPLREEVDAVISAEGWSKAAMDKMRKIDSFLKESQRMMGPGALSMMRKAMRDVAFGDGTFIPAGTIVSVAAMVHHDEAAYEAPDVFDPWRFASMRDEAGEGTKYQMVSTSVDYLVFGYGRHACPGRFFVVNEMKAMLAHVVMTYDVKMEEEGVLPPHSHFKSSFVPNRNAKVLFRKRQE